MRPSRLLLRLALASFAVTLLAVVAAQNVALAVLPWLALGVAMLIDGVLARSMRRATLDADVPPEIFAGEEVPLQIGAVGIAGPARLALDLPQGIGGKGIADIGGEPVTIPLTAERRGKYRINAATLTAHSPLGLLEIVLHRDPQIAFAVVPNIRPIRSGRIEAMMLGSLSGLKDSRLRGEGSDFHQLREYAPGLDPRSIDWKRSARASTLLAKEMRAERGHQVVLAIDSGYLMRAEISGLAKLDHAINAALALVWAAGLGGDLAGLFAFDARPSLWIPPAPARAAFARLRSAMATLEYRTVEANHTLALSTLNGFLNRRSLVVVFSDFADSTTAELLVENTAILARHHVVVFVALTDPALAARLQRAARSLDTVAEAVATDQMLSERREVIARLRRLGIDVLDSEPQAITADLVSAYLRIKERELIG